MGWQTTAIARRRRWKRVQEREIGRRGRGGERETERGEAEEEEGQGERQQTCCDNISRTSVSCPVRLNNADCNYRKQREFVSVVTPLLSEKRLKRNEMTFVGFENILFEMCLFPSLNEMRRLFARFSRDRGLTLLEVDSVWKLILWNLDTQVLLSLQKYLQKHQEIFIHCIWTAVLLMSGISTWLDDVEYLFICIGPEMKK